MTMKKHRCIIIAVLQMPTSDNNKAAGRQPAQADALGIAIIGAGTVGGGVLSILNDNAKGIRARCGRHLQVVAIAVRRLAAAKKRLPQQYAPMLTTDWQQAVNHPQVDIVVELMGGTGEAARCIRHSIKLGKPVITANKAALAESDILDGEGAVFFEAAVAGAVPVVKTLRESLAGDSVGEVFGIINGTCNYILSVMDGEGLAFDEALRRAGDKGYAEADPSLDIDGTDAAHKLALISRLAFGARPRMADIGITGVRGMDINDIRYARQLGFAVKLIARAAMSKGELAMSVRPMLVPQTDMLAAVGGAMNAVIIRSANAGETMLYGAGAGAKPTAVAVVADMIDIARGNPPPLPTQPAKAPKIKTQNNLRRYVRLCAKDKPGALADITALLAKNGISVDAIHQSGGAATADIAFLTHHAKDDALAKCIKDVKKLRAVVGDVITMPVVGR